MFMKDLIYKHLNGSQVKGILTSLEFRLLELSKLLPEGDFQIKSLKERTFSLEGRYNNRSYSVDETLLACKEKDPSLYLEIIDLLDDANKSFSIYL